MNDLNEKVEGYFLMLHEITETLSKKYKDRGDIIREGDSYEDVLHESKDIGLVKYSKKHPAFCLTSIELEKGIYKDMLMYFNGYVKGNHGFDVDWNIYNEEVFNTVKRIVIKYLGNFDSLHVKKDY